MAASPQDRSAILDRECGDDGELRREVESLLDARTQALLRTAGAAHSLAATITESAPSAERPGDMVGRYKLLERIGEGGMGSVWMAEQREPVKRRVAVKVIKIGMDTRQVIARFEAERQALALMDHPHIAKVLDAGATETGRPYFVMEYIKGVPILEYCDTTALDTKARLALFTSVCYAIQHAHQKGIIHRDIKPSNILVTMHDGVPVPKVIDFGIAKATNAELTEKTIYTQHRQMIGTPAYMSPEQAEMSGLDIDTRSDIYAVGVLLYELLTGTTPFANRDLMEKGFAEMMRIIREVEPDRPSTRLSSLGETATRAAQQRGADVKKLGTILRGDLDWIVMKCLEKDRTQRYETANGLAEDIERHLRHEPVTAGAPSAGYRLRKFGRRNRGQVVAAGIAAGGLVLGVIGTTAGMVWALDEKAKATRAAESEAQAKVTAQENERRAVASTKAAEAAKDEESKSRRHAETINAFVTTALRSSDAQTSHFKGGLARTGGGTTNPVHDMTILAAMKNAVRDIDSGRFKDDPETEAGLRDTIGNILRNNAKYDEAKPLLEKALAIRERMFGSDALIVGASVNNLGEVYFQQGQYREAEPLLKRALTILERCRGPDHPDVAISLNNLAVLYGTAGQLDRVEPLLVRALAILEKALAPDDPAVADGLSNLAVLYVQQRQFARAQPLHERALAIRSNALGPDHTDVANSLFNLALLHRDAGHGAESEPLYQQALAVYEKALGPDHPLVASCLGGLAGLYMTQGRHAQARALYTRALAMDEKSLGPDHPSVAFRLGGLAMVLHALGEYAEAERLLTRGLAIREKTRAVDDLEMAYEVNCLGECHFARGQYARAEPLFRKGLAIREKLFPSEDPELAASLNNLAAFHCAQGQFAEAEPLHLRALAIREKAL